MEENLFNLLESSNSILILLPSKPYFDQVAAGLSLFLTLRQEKEVAIACPSDMTVEFNRLVGVNKITKELGNKNMVVQFVDYKALGIERVSYDIDDGEFKLTVIPKAGVRPPNKDQVVISYSGVSADTAILIGGANTSHFPELARKELEVTRKIHVGIRELQGADSGIISLTQPSSSDSELVATLIKQSGKSIDEDVATNLISGIESGSNHFSSQQVTAETFQLLADLMRAGGKRKIQGQETSFPPSSISGEKLQEDETPTDWKGPKIYKSTSIN